MRIAAVTSALPPYFYSQSDLVKVLTSFWLRRHHNPLRVAQFHENVQVNGRYLSLPIEQYEQLADFSAANQAFIRAGEQLAIEVTLAALAEAKLKADDIDAIFFTTVTGLSVPTLETKLINKLGFRRDVKRIPLFGLGCVAGAAGLARMHDYLKAYPRQTALLVAVELCSLTIQTNDLSIPNLIATGLFGDGAAAVIGIGIERKHLPGSAQIMASESIFYPNTEQTMGWDIGSHGFKIVLDAKVPQLARDHLGTDVDHFLHKQRLTRSDISHWICHPGGPKVLEAIQEALELPETALALTWESLRNIGNLSSVSVLLILQETLRKYQPHHDKHALLLAMGPGFCSELVHIKW